MTPLLLAVLVSATPVVDSQPESPCDEKPALIAVKVMPNYAARLFNAEGAAAGFGLSAGVELRVTNWLALRSDVDFRKAGHTFDFLGVKLSLPEETWRPFASVSVSGDFPADKPGNSYLGATGALGLDVVLTRNFFVTAEARARTTREQPLTGAVVVGLGLAFL